MNRFALLSPLPPALYFCLLAGSTLQPAQSVTVHFTLCAVDRSTDCVIDGDTIRWDGEVVRIEDIDAPEIHDYGCPTELALGQRATIRLRELLNGGAVTLRQAGSRDTDPYGRKLRVIIRDAVSLSDILVAEGLARPWTGSRRPWCV